MLFKKYLIENIIESPYRRLDTTYIVDLLSNDKIGEKLPLRNFQDHIQWGNVSGSVRLRWSTKNEALVEKLQHNLLGDPTWITKRMANYNKEHFGGKEEAIAHDLYKSLTEIFYEPQESPNKEFSTLYKLVKNIVYKTSESLAKPLFHEDIVKVNENHYYIVYRADANGWGAPNQHNINEILINMKFEPETGFLNVSQTNVESHTEQNWQLQPSDFNLYFSPVQSTEEIAKVVHTILKFF